MRTSRAVIIAVTSSLFAMGDGDDLLRQARLTQRVDQLDRGEGCEIGRLEQHRIAAGDGRAKLVRDKVQRVVVRGDGGDDAERFPSEPALALFRAGIGIEGHDFAGIALCRTEIGARLVVMWSLAAVMWPGSLFLMDLRPEVAFVGKGGPLPRTGFT